MLKPRSFLFVSIASFARLFGAEPAHQAIHWDLPAMMREGSVDREVWGSPSVVIQSGRAAVAFDGAKDGLILGINPLEDLKTFTVEALIFPASDGPEEQRFFHAADDGDRRALLETRVGNGSWALDTFLRNGTDQRAMLDLEKRHPADQWHWVAMTYDGATLRAYVNGQLELSGDVNWVPMAAGKTSLGVRQNRVYWFKGALAEVRIHPKALSATDLQHTP